jgi:hypothetical protein
MPILAKPSGHNIEQSPAAWHLTLGSHAVNLVLQILETR